MTQCHLCGSSLKQPSKCILCDQPVCENHSRSFEVGAEKSDNSQRKLNAYICDECMKAVEELKKKPREEWTEEDKEKSKGMIDKIVMTLGAAAMVIITGIFLFALWIYAKAKGEEDAPDETATKPSSGSEWSFPSESLDESSFAEEQSFKEHEPGVAM